MKYNQWNITVQKTTLDTIIAFMVAEHPNARISIDYRYMKYEQRIVAYCKRQLDAGNLHVNLTGIHDI